MVRVEKVLIVDKPAEFLRSLSVDAKTFDEIVDRVLVYMDEHGCGGLLVLTPDSPPEYAELSDEVAQLVRKYINFLLCGM